MSEVIYKDYFNEKEAAAYCCVSYRQFRKLKDSLGIVRGVFMGKLVYRRADLQRAIEEGAFKEWRPAINTTVRGTSSGRKTARGIRNVSAESQSSQQLKQG